MSAELVVSTHGFTTQKRIVAEAVEFHTSAQGWAKSRCVILGDEPLEFACKVLSEIAAVDGERFTGRVYGPDGDLRGAWSLNGVDTQTAQGADAFLYFENEEGFWEGVTLAFNRDRLAIHEFEIDPL